MARLYISSEPKSISFPDADSSMNLFTTIKQLREENKSLRIELYYTRREIERLKYELVELTAANLGRRKKVSSYCLNRDKINLYFKTGAHNVIKLYFDLQIFS